MLPGPASSPQEHFTETLEIKSSTAGVFFWGGGGEKENAELYVMHDFSVFKKYLCGYRKKSGKTYLVSNSCYFWEV